ncbi:MAG: hypothetical protein CR984_02690 [Proteobacteria bacterium]|nr:MAG: hypothetical protein CR984_02690 [Pseudomonadota bacterium]
MYRQLYLLLFAAILLTMGADAAIASQATNQEAVWILLADLSGSMQADVSLRPAVDASLPGCPKTDDQNAETEDDRTLSKAALVKRLVMSSGRRLAEDQRVFGLLAVEYVAGRRACYREILAVQRHDADEVVDRICEDLDTDVPVFNRRSPLGDVLRQVDADLLETLNGNITLVVFSDGRDSFYDFDEDRDASRADPLNADDAVQGPITEGRRLAERYPGRVRMLTVLVETEDEADDDAVGRRRLTEMAETGRGAFFDTRPWYRAPRKFETLIRTLTSKGTTSP